MNILITGASSGFGKELALEYAQKLDNLELFLLARREKNLLELKEKIDLLGKNIKVSVYVADIRDCSFLEKKFKDLSIDILVNNAGLAREKISFDKVKIDDCIEMIDVNIKALAFLTNLILPNMIKQGSGHIVNIGSIAGTYPYPGGNIYGASKAFVKQFSNNLRADLYDKNIRVTNIEPGLCNGSDFSLTRFRGDEQKANKTYENTNPLHAKDIANAIFWATTLPNHVNINSIELMPTTQACADLNVYRDKSI